jgi:hypothetical protein
LELWGVVCRQAAHLAALPILSFYFRLQTRRRLLAETAGTAKKKQLCLTNGAPIAAFWLFLGWLAVAGFIVLTLGDVDDLADAARSE